MSVVDIGIVLFILMYGIIGFKRGFIKQTTMFVGLFIVIIISFILKDPIANFMFEKLPFFDFWGIIKGVTVLNILLYEIVAFFFVFGILSILLRLFTFISSILEKVLNFTIILGIPSKILGFIVGLIEGYIIVFLIAFVLSQPIINFGLLKGSKYAPRILSETPILSQSSKNTVATFNEIYSLKDKYKNSQNNAEFNRQSLDILLKYKIISVESIEKLISSGKLELTNIEPILKKYR
jgi:uncharacterized membrane protein required for colicin V production